MPTPVGHALAGVALGWLIEGRQALLTRAGALTTVAYGMVAASPDLDLLLETHRGPMHGVGFAAIAWLSAWVLTRRARTAAAFGLAYGSHVLLDWLGTDTTPPIGLMALWPFSREYYESPFHIFMAVSRRYWLSEFWTYNFRVLVRELLILGPAVLATGLLRGRLRRIIAVAVVTSALLQGATAGQAFAQTNTPCADALAIEEALGRRARAAELYAEAMKWFLAGRVAYVGLGEALYVDPQPEAAMVMTSILERPAPRDPSWRACVMGEWWHYDARLAAMQNRVRQ